ncbi:PQQ-binding-like beta-propeller repeat protein [Parvularcula sp. LCG005]|uniref:outer membrane protein assembly factor BamB family protein n=1 Tax=Parvularcula sp. LCG005 TaxID=3078805 RepID=UPI00294244F7|nr:PQQ-binding-like beta-propeller repeat protein [Parvularcula sp. LCG005]WOI54155.1 PQQ-binding-like beta-propeller repeat protein [Parvularcula sp. LCG005]
MAILRNRFWQPFSGVVALSLLAAGCSSNPVSGLFSRGDSDITAEAAAAAENEDRIPVLALTQQLEPDPRFIGLEIEVPPAFANAEWAQPGGEADHVMHHLSGPESYRLAWQANIGKGGKTKSPLTAPPIVAERRVYTIDAEAKVRAFDTDTGERVWEAALTPDVSEPNKKFWQLGRINPAEIGYGGGVAYQGGTVFVVSGFGFAAALNAETGEKIWEKQLPAPVRNPPTAVDGRVYVITTANQVLALDEATGRELWTYESFEESARFLSTGSAAVEGDLVVTPFSSGEIAALDASTGRFLWTATIARSSRMNALSSINDIAGSPVIDRGAVFAVSHSGQMAAIDGRTGRVAWEKGVSGLNMPWVAGDYLFLISTDGDLVALSRNDGAVVWRTGLKGYENEKKKKKRITWSGPILAGNSLLLTSSAGDLAQISPKDGTVEKTYRLKAGTMIPPVVADGTVYVITDDAKLQAWR